MTTLKKLFILITFSIFAIAAIEIKQAAPFPARTIFIKHPAANDLKTFFNSTSLYFEVYKPGSASQVSQMVKKIQQDKHVQSFVSGTSNGEYQSFALTLKSAKDKQYYMNLFKNSGLTNIRINNQPVTTVDKL